MRRAFPGPCAVLPLLAASAAAEPAGDVPLRIAYRAPASCPDEAAFRSQLISRTQQARFAEPDEPAQSVQIVIESSTQRARARLELTDIDGQRVLREVEAASCAEAVSAIALVTALAVEARLEEAPEAQPADIPRSPPPARPPPAPQPAIQPAPLPAPAEAAPPAESGAPRAWLAGARGGFVTEIAPDGMYLVRAFGGLQPGGAAVELRLSLTYGAGNAVREGGLLQFRGAFARADACWLPLASRRGAVGPCAGVEGGAVWARGVRTPPRIEVPNSTTVPWAALAGLLRARLVERFLFVELELELVVPLSDHTFALENPPADVHEFPDIAFGGGLGVGVFIE